jgi:fatty acid desaturase
LTSDELRWEITYVPSQRDEQPIDVVSSTKFSADTRALGRAILPPTSPELRELSRRRPLRLFADVAVCYLAMLAAFTLLAWCPSLLSAIVAFVVIGNRQYALSILTHDGDHGTLLDSRRANDLFCEIVLCPVVGVDFAGERVNHLGHHRHLATPADPDRYLYSVSDKATRLDFALFLTGLTMFPRALRKAMGKASTAVPVARPSGLRAFLRSRGTTLAFQALIFAGICYVFDFGHYVAFWIAPIYVMVFVPHKIRMFCEHAQPVLPDSAADDRRMVTFRPSALERLVFSPFNLNHHTEHHLWPFVPYYNLHKLHPWIAKRDDVEVRSSYLAFVVRYMVDLPLVRETSTASSRA